MRRLLSLPLALTALIAFASGCGSGGTTTVTGGSIALTLSPTTASIQQGSSTQVTGTIVRTNFTGDISIAVNGVPDGVTGVVTVAPVNGGNSAQVTLTAASTTAAGTYTLTVVASGSGVTNATATYTLTITPLPASFFTFSVAPTSPSVAQGGSVQIIGTAVRHSFTGDIAISVSGAPTGVTTNVTLAPVNGGNTAQISVAVGSTAAPGPSVLTVTASGGGTVITATVNLTVTVAGSFTLSPSAATVNVTQGANATTPVTAVRSGGFSGTLVYTTTNATNGALPVGLTAAVTPTGTADLSTLTVTAAAGLAVGPYTVVVHAAAFGLEQTEVVTVNVAAPGAGIHLDYSACSAALKPIWVAYQDGNGAFTRVTGTGDVYTFTLNSSKGALATVTQNGSNFTTSVLYFSQAEFGAQTGACAATPATKTINGSVTGIVSPNNPEISMGGATAFTLVSSPNFQLTGVPTGVLDLIAYNRTAQFALSTSDQIIIRRDLNIADQGTISPPLNFATEAAPVGTSTINVSGGAVNSYFVTMNYLMGATCASNKISFTTNGVPSPFLAYGVAGSAAVRSSDFHNLFLQQINGQADTRTLSVSFHALANQTLSIGAGIGTVTTTVLAGAYQRLQAAFGLASDYNSASFSYGVSGATFNRFFITQSAGYLGTVTTVTLTPPDLTTVTGYLTTWGPATSGGLQYSASATSAVPATMCAEGATLRTASSSVGGA